MGPQRKMGIYVSYDSPSIIRYLEPLIGDLFTTSLGGDKHANVHGERRELSWYAPTMSYLDPHIAQFETEVRRIIDLQSIAQSMPDAFTDLAKMTRSHIPATNAPEPSLKRGRLLGLKDSKPCKRKTTQTSDPSLNPTIAHSSILTYEVILDYGDVLDETTRPPENREILVHYAVLDEVWNQNKMIVDDQFAYTVATNIMLSNNIEACSVDEYRRRTDWSNWK
ncbi:hypothetical protein ACFX1Q_013733 [Malus domestica]